MKGWLEWLSHRAGLINDNMSGRAQSGAQPNRQTVLAVIEANVKVLCVAIENDFSVLSRCVPNGERRRIEQKLGLTSERIRPSDGRHGIVRASRQRNTRRGTFPC